MNIMVKGKKKKANVSQQKVVMKVEEEEFLNI